MSTASAPTFERDIKPLFRPKDRDSMIDHFDLWSYEDVKRYAGDIYDVVLGGTMPCDGAWPPEAVKLFESWKNGDQLP